LRNSLYLTLIDQWYSTLTKRPKKSALIRKEKAPAAYRSVLSEVVELLEAARHTAARSVNAVMTATYWSVGRRIIESEQGGEGRARYGKALLKRLSADLTSRFGRGFSVDNLEMMRLFYQTYQPGEIYETVSRKSDMAHLAARFPLPWSHYVLLMRRTK
jgi:hypothetical protein